MIKSFKGKVIITMFLAILFTTLCAPIMSFAITQEYMGPDQFDNKGYTQITDTKIAGKGSLGDLMKKLFGTILTILRIFTVGWAILMMISIATKYMTGSAQIKAQIKTDVPTYMIGAAVLFGASGILTLIQYFIEDNVK